jgi:hypothetical protein
MSKPFYKELEDVCEALMADSYQTVEELQQARLVLTRVRNEIGHIDKMLNQYHRSLTNQARHSE